MVAEWEDAEVRWGGLVGWVWLVAWWMAVWEWGCGDVCEGGGVSAAAAAAVQG